MYTACNHAYINKHLDAAASIASRKRVLGLVHLREEGLHRGRPTQGRFLDRHAGTSQAAHLARKLRMADTLKAKDRTACVPWAPRKEPYGCGNGTILG